MAQKHRHASGSPQPSSTPQPQAADGGVGVGPTPAGTPNLPDAPTEGQLKGMITQMEQQLAALRERIAQSQQTAERTTKALQHQRDTAQAWTDKAAKAHEAGRSDLAREAARYQQRHERYAEQLEQERARHDTLARRFRQTADDFALRIEEAKVKIEIVWARKHCARTQRTAEAPARQLAQSLDRFDTLIHRLEAEMDIDHDLHVQRRAKPRIPPPPSSDNDA